jgi:hypothetical protein
MEMANSGQRDWAAWSREAVSLLQQRNDRWLARFGLSKGAPYRWDLDAARIIFQRGDDILTAHLRLVGSISACQGTFLWGWANDSIPVVAREGLEVLRSFGQQNELNLLIEPEWPAHKADGLEMLAVASRVLDADGSWVDQSGDLTLFFLLDNFRVQSH